MSADFDLIWRETTFWHNGGLLSKVPCLDLQHPAVADGEERSLSEALADLSKERNPLKPTIRKLNDMRN